MLQQSVYAVELERQKGEQRLKYKLCDEIILIMGKKV